MRANSIAAIVAVLLGAVTVPAAAQAQSVWSGPGSTTNTSDYNLDTNWGPAASPVVAGQSAIFKGGGKANIAVGVPISPDSWTFNANSKSFSIGGADVNFSLAGAAGGIINKANSGQTISISNNIGEMSAGVRVQQSGNSTLILSGANTYSGGTLVSNGGTLRANKSSSIGTGTVTLDNGQFQAGGANLTFSNNFIVNNTPAGSAIDNNNRVLTLSGNIADGNGPGMLTFVNSFTGPSPNPNARTILTGTSTYTGGTVICDCAAVQLGDVSHTASIVGKITNEGQLEILNADTTAITRIVNTGATGFFNTTSAGTATIVNSALLEFANQSTAGDATIRNIGGGVGFLNHATAGNATIINRAGGLLAFANNSTAGDATITTRQSAQTAFHDHGNGGNARFITNGTGVVDFSDTTGAGGLHQITAGSIEGSGSYFIGVGNTLSVGGNNLSTEVSGVIADSCGCTPGSGALAKVGTGTLILSGTNTYTGGTTITAGTLQLGNGTATGSILGDVVNNATLAFNRTDAYQFDGVISGSGAVQQNGAGTTNLTALNTYTGTTTINAGTLALTGAGDISNSSGVVANGVFDISGVSGAGSSIQSLSGAGGSVVLGAKTLTTGSNDASTSFDGSIDGTGGLTKTGTGTFTLQNTLGGPGFTYTGTTNVDAGLLRAGSLGAFASASTFVVASVAILDLNNFDQSIGALAGTGKVMLGTGNLTAGGNNASTSFSGEISGSGGLTKTGSGTLVLTEANTYTGGTTISAGTLQLGTTAASTGSVAGDIVDNARLVFAKFGSTTFSGAISGSGSVAIEDAPGGFTFFTGNNTYTGGTTITTGILSIGNGGTAGSIVGNVLNNSAIDFNRPDDSAFDGSVSGSGVLRKFGAGVLSLTGDSTHSGGTEISGGTLQLGNGTTTGSILGDVMNNATLAFNRSNTYQFDGVISGTGAVQQNGSGTTTLTAVSTYAGATTISAGTLALSGAGSIANSSGVIDNGIFDISATTSGTSIKTLSGTGSVPLGNRTLTLTDASGTFAGGISGLGGLIKQGAGLFVLSDANTYAGATAVAGGELRVNGSVAGAVNVQSGATLSGIGTVNGLVTIQSNGTLSAGQSPGTLTLGALNLNAGSNSVFELGSAGVVGGTSNDLVNVTGNLTLGGTLSVNAPSAGYYRLFNYGTLTASSFDAINGSSGGTPTVLTNVPNQVNLSIAAAGQRIQFWDGADQAGNGVVNGGTGIWNAANTNWTGAPGQAGINDQWRSSVGVFAGTAGTVTVTGSQSFDTLQFSTTGYVLNAGAGGQLQLAGLSGTGTINTDSGIAATIDAPIGNGSSQSLTKVGGGTLILSGANTYSGGTLISGGTLQLGNGSTTGSILGNVTNNAVFAINRSSAIIFDGNISGSGAFQQLGTGTTILTADNTYTGGTTISAGTLQLGNGGPTGSIVGNVLNNAKISFDRDFYNFAGSISGNGSMQVMGGFLGLTGDNTFSGGTTITSGVLAIGGLGGGGTTGTLTGNVVTGPNSISSPNQLWFTRTDNSTFDGSISGSGLIAKFGGGTLTLTGTNSAGGTVISDGVVQIGNGGTSGSLAGSVSFLGTTSTLRFNRSDTLLVSDFIGSGGFVEQAGSGTVVLTGTISGSPVSIAAGTLQIGNGGTTGSIVGNVTDNSVLAFNRSNALTFDGVISGVGAVSQIGTGTTILTADNSYSGGTTISAGTLQLGNGGTTGSIVGNVTDNSVLVFNRSNALTFDGVISGVGAVSQIGTGTTILTVDNSYSGGTTISAGTLQLGNGGTTGSIVGNVIDNATLAFNHSNAVTFAGVISGTGALDQIGSGTTTLSGANTYTGATMVTSGTLTIEATGSITSNVTNNATFNNAGVIFGSVGNVLGSLNNSGTITGSVGNNGTFINSGTVGTTVNNFKIFNNNAGGFVTGLLDNAAGTTINAGTLNGGARVDGGILINNNLISGPVNISTGGQVDNNLTIAGAVSNSATFNNNAAGTVSGLLSNSASFGPFAPGITTNAGHLDGGASVTGGTLTTTGTILNGLANSATVNANGGAVNGAIANNANGTFNVGGMVTSDNSFTNAASATLAIGPSGAYTLQGLLANSGAITVAGGGQLIATVGGITNNAGGTITVALGGTVKDDLYNAGAITNNGAYIANVATNTGTIANNGGWTGNVVSNTGTIDNNKTWTGTVSNAGTFNNNAGATVSGLLTNTAGTTTNNGALNGGANVSGGTFTGSGSVSNLTVSAGILAPGNGTPGSSMMITGNLAFQSGAMYLVALNPTTASFASVGGIATLNGSAAAVYLAGNYVSKKYTILTGAGGVSGAFGPLVNANLPANFSSSLSYDANNAYINLALNFVPNPTPNFGSGLNINQQNVATTLVNFFNSTGGIPAVFGSLSPGGLTQVSGELTTASQQTTFDAMNLFLGLLTDPFVAGRDAGVTAGAPSSQFAEQGDASAYAASGKPRSRNERDAYAAVYRKAPLREVYDPRWSVWAAGYGGSQTTDGNATLGSNHTRSSIGAVAVGADYLFSPRTIAGFAVAGGGTSFSVNGSGSGRSDLFQAGAFVRHSNGPAYVSAALAYGWQDVTTDRTVAIAGADLLRANFNANAFSGRLEAGYRFVTPWMTVGLTPYAAGQFTTFDLPGYAEQAIAGANSFALNYAAKDVTASRSELGLRSDKSYPMQDGIFTLRGRAAWAHNFNPDRNIAATFQALPGASFVVNGAAQAGDSGLVTGSAEMKWLNGFALAATFEGEFSNVTRSYAGKGVARYSW